MQSAVLAHLEKMNKNLVSMNKNLEAMNEKLDNVDVNTSPPSRTWQALRTVAQIMAPAREY